MAKPYAKLRGKLAEADINNEALASHFNHSPSYASERMMGKRYHWDIEEAYAILELLNIPPEEIGIYFPKKGGKNDKA